MRGLNAGPEESKSCWTKQNGIIRGHREVVFPFLSHKPQGNGIYMGSLRLPTNMKNDSGFDSRCYRRDPQNQIAHSPANTGASKRLSLFGEVFPRRVFLVSDKVKHGKMIETAQVEETWSHSETGAALLIDFHQGWTAPGVRAACPPRNSKDKSINFSSEK